MSSADPGQAGAQRARDTLSILLDYYAGRPASKESVDIGIRIGDIPTEAQGRSLQAKLSEMLRINEIISNLGPNERAQMESSATSSRNRRGGRGRGNGSG